MGVEVLKYLHTLNLSHNFIKNIHGLKNSQQLEELDLSMNHIEDISYLPTLSNLRILHLSNNRVLIFPISNFSRRIVI